MAVSKATGATDVTEVRTAGPVAFDRTRSVTPRLGVIHLKSTCNKNGLIMEPLNHLEVLASRAALRLVLRRDPQSREAEIDSALGDLNVMDAQTVLEGIVTTILITLDDLAIRGGFEEDLQSNVRALLAALPDIDSEGGTRA